MPKINNSTSLLLLVCVSLNFSSAAYSQNFLNSVTSTGTSFLNSGGATGNISNSSGYMTGPGAINLGVPSGRIYGLQTMGNGLLAPSSTSNAAYSSGTYSYGFAQPSLFNINPLAGSSQYGSYAGQGLPTVSSGSADINTVDCPYLRESYGTGSIFVNPLLNLSIPGLGNVNLTETPQEAVNFLQNSFTNAVTNVDNAVGSVGNAYNSGVHAATSIGF